MTTSVVPGLTQVTQNVQAAPRGDFRYPWVNLVDLRFARSFKAGSMRFEPTIDIYNVFNNNAILSDNVTYGPQWLKPTSILSPRLIEFGGRVDF